MLKKLLAMMLVLGVVIVEVYAANSKVGTSGLAFLKIVPGSRPAALGGTYGAIGNDVNSLVLNPAGIAELKKKEVIATHISWFQGINYEYIAIGIPVNFGVIGIGINSVSYGDMEKRTSATDEPEGTFSASDSAINLSYAKVLSESLCVGLNIKSINSKIDDVSATPVTGIDLGVLYKVNANLNLGLGLQNIGSGIKYIDDTSPLPTNIKLGLGYKIRDGLIIGLDVNKPNDNDSKVSIGGEYNIGLGQTIVLPVRLGYATGIDAGGISAGIGFSYSNLGIDITFAPYGDLGNTLRAGIKFVF